MSQGFWVAAAVAIALLLVAAIWLRWELWPSGREGQGVRAKKVGRSKQRPYTVAATGVPGGYVPPAGGLGVSPR